MRISERTRGFLRDERTWPLVLGVVLTGGFVVLACHEYWTTNSGGIMGAPPLRDSPRSLGGLIAIAIEAAVMFGPIGFVGALAISLVFFGARWLYRSIKAGQTWWK